MKVKTRFANIEVTPAGFQGTEISPPCAWAGQVVQGQELVNGKFVDLPPVTMPTGPTENKFSASFPLFLIREAWSRGLDMEDLADGFGEGMGTMDGDWSGIRDSSPEALNLMLQKTLNHLFPKIG